MNNLLKQLMADTAKLPFAGRLTDATALIQKTLRKAGLSDAASTVFPMGLADWNAAALDLPGTAMPAPASTDTEEFIRCQFTQAGRTLEYKLFIPQNRPDRPVPLVVMLHGCTQNADDFAAGTAMNEQARQHGFLVVYPEQSASANPQRCWNWFKHNHQGPGSGEPALIAGITQALMSQYAIDENRIYIAGLSAGAAMAAIVAHAYPQIFAAVGMHSGLPRGAASNVGEALAVMKNGALPTANVSDSSIAHARYVPTIVFHGDQDQTVHPRNSDNVIAAVLGQADGLAVALSAVEVKEGTSTHGRRYTCTVHHAQDGAPIAEHWVIHGGGHAWSGGRSQGSYTDATGPDATHEMLRFFTQAARRV